MNLMLLFYRSENIAHTLSAKQLDENNYLLNGQLPTMMMTTTTSVTTATTMVFKIIDLVACTAKRNARSSDDVTHHHITVTVA